MVDIVHPTASTNIDWHWVRWFAHCVILWRSPTLEHLRSQNSTDGWLRWIKALVLKTSVRANTTDREFESHIILSNRSMSTGVDAFKALKKYRTSIRYNWQSGRGLITVGPYSYPMPKIPKNIIVWTPCSTCGCLKRNHTFVAVGSKDFAYRPCSCGKCWKYVGRRRKLLYTKWKKLMLDDALVA